MNTKISKKERHKQLKEILKNDPFINDEELSDHFSVSIQTVRLDRMELGIPELRERIKNVAEKAYDSVKTLEGKEIVGELIHLQLGIRAISILETDTSMVFEKSKVVRGHYIYSLAESLAISLIDAETALTGVANIKYKEPVFAGERLIATAEVTKIIGNKNFVAVRIKIKDKEIFRGKFILVSIITEV